MGDRVAVIRKGELQQVAPPQELYDDPVNLFVGGFIGSPAMNMVLATPRADDGRISLEFGSARLSVSDEQVAAALASHVGREVVCGVRPEDLDDVASASSSDGGGRLRGTVTLREPLGAEVLVHIEVEGRPAVTDDVRELAADTGEERTVEQLAGRNTTTLVARFDPRTRVRDNEQIDVAVDTGRLHVFDVTTGMAIR
jgi:multiple sugar transport system ATP-binding protein